MKRAKHAVLVALLVALAVPSSAGAWTPPTDHPLTSRFAIDSLRVARAFWGGQPNCPTGVRIYVSSLQAIASADGTRTAAGTADGCRIWLDPNLFEDPLPAPWDYGDRIKRCNVVVHEFGHLLNGPDHSTNPLSIMAPEANLDVDAMGCYRRFKPGRITRAQDREAFDAPRIWAVR